MSGKARYKDHDEEKAKLLEEKYSSREKKIDFHVLSVQSVQEIKGIIRLLKVMLEKENGNWDKVKEQNDEYKAETGFTAVSYTHLRAHETGRNLVCRLLLEKKKKKIRHRLEKKKK